MINVYIIIIAVLVSVMLAGLIVFVAVWKSRYRRKAEPPHSQGTVVSIVGMDSIVPEIQRKSNGQLFSPETVRAHKFRQRARITSLGRPDFRLSTKQKTPKSNLYEAIEDNPGFREYESLEEKSNMNERNLAIDSQIPPNENEDGKEILQNDLEMGNNSQSGKENYPLHKTLSFMENHLPNTTIVETIERVNSFKLNRNNSPSKGSSHALLKQATNSSSLDLLDHPIVSVLKSEDSVEKILI